MKVPSSPRTPTVGEEDHTPRPRPQDNKLFTRKEKPLPKADQEEFVKEHMNAKCAEIEKGSQEIHGLLSNSNRTLKVSKGAQAWRNYVDYVGNIIVDGLSKSVLASLRHLREELDPKAMAKNSRLPLLEVELKLQEAAPGTDQETEVVWEPRVGSTEEGTGIRDMVTGWLRRITNVINLMKRLDVGEGTYGAELEDDFVIYDEINRLQDLVMGSERECAKFHDMYLKFKGLWAQNPQAELMAFLEREAVYDPETKERLDDPPLEKFEEQIAKYKAIQEELSSLSTTVDIGWLRVSCKTIKSQLNNRCSQWVFK